MSNDTKSSLINHNDIDIETTIRPTIYDEEGHYPDAY